MNSFVIKIAGLPIGVEAMYPETAAYCAAYRTDETPLFSVGTGEDDIVFERKKNRSEYVYEGVACPERTPQELEVTAVYRKIAQVLPQYGAFVFHGAAVAVGERAYLFTAGSGTGKTTHIGLWLKNIAGSYVVNGDKPILRLMDGVPFVCGTPWMGKERYGRNCMVPLAGLCHLTRGAENKITPVSVSEVLPVLIGQTYRPPESKALVMTVKTLGQIAGITPLYRLECNTEDEAAWVSYGGMGR